MKRKITNFLGALALATTLGVTSATAATPSAVIKPTIDKNAKPAYFIQAPRDSINWDNVDFGPATRLQNGIGLPVIRYGKMFPKNPELGNTAGYNPLALDPLQFQSLNGQIDCVPREEYDSIIKRLAAAFDSTKTVYDNEKKELVIKYNDCKGENKELRVQIREKGRELDSVLTRTENLQRLVRLAETSSATNSTSRPSLHPANSKGISLDQLAEDYNRSYPDEPMRPVTGDDGIVRYEIVSNQPASQNHVEHTSSLGSSLGISAYAAPGVGLNANFGHFTLGLGVVKANQNKDSSLETKTITNVPAPGFRTVYTEEFSTQEETNQMAFLANLGYNFSRRVSLLAGAEIASRETSGKQTNTIRHYLDNVQISQVSEVIPTEKETKTEVYPTFGLRLGLSNKLSLEGQYSTSGQYFAGLNLKLGGSK